MQIVAESKPQLTLREREIVSLIATGLSAKEVAAELRIAPRTVEGHLENCRHKFGARNRIHLVVRCASLGFIRIDQMPETRCANCLFRQSYKTEDKLNVRAMV